MQNMDFDTTVSRPTPDGGFVIDYGIIYGDGGGITFIKSGKGGSHRGSEDKYVKMALRINARTGNTVICGSNPEKSPLTYLLDREVIREVADERALPSPEINLIGSSNGGYQVIFLANRLENVKKLLCINMPIMINYHKFTRELSLMGEVEKIFVYGTKDPSYPYSDMLKMKKYPLCRVIIAEGADHQFLGMTDKFIALSDYLSHIE